MHAVVETPREAVQATPRQASHGFRAWPARLRRGHRLTSITILAWAVRLAAILNLLAFSQHHSSRFIHWIAAWVPFEVSIGRRVLMLLTAILLFVLSSGLERGKRLALIFTIAALTCAPLIHLGRAVIWPQILLNMPLVILLCANHRFFIARSDARSLRSALIISPLLLTVLMIYGTIRLHDLRLETSGSDSWLGCLQAALELVLVQNSHAQHALTHQALILFSELRIGGTSIALITLYLALRPAFASRRDDPQDTKLMSLLVQEHGSDPLHAYALLGDKSFFFNSSKSVGIPFVLSSRFAVVLAGPVGPREDLPAAVQEFMEFCRRQDWVPLFYQIAHESLALYQRLGLSTVKIGEDARLDAASFDLKGSAFQNLRTLCNKARKNGFQFRWYEEADETDLKLEAQLSHISKLWLAEKNGAEMTFDMGSFSLAEIRRNGVAVMLDADGQCVAFTTWRPFAQGRGMVLDLMRSLPQVRNILDVIIVESIRHYREQGVRYISLGNAPLANADQCEKYVAVEDRAVRFLYENLNHVYAYKPLFEFKRKYRPRWLARYLAYPAHESLPLIGLALVRVHTKRGIFRMFTG